MPERVTIGSVEVTLVDPDQHDAEWLDYNHYALQLQAAWFRLSPDEVPLNPRLIGAPGLGKTTLATAVGRSLNRDVYIFQCTMDTRPEDLVITPVLAGDGHVEYRASPVVSAMVRGGVAVLDEGNRMPERSWASLAPLMDDRRYMESAAAAVTIPAHPDFRLCVTMNTDASVYELPGYIQSRLKPKIELVQPPWDMQEAIVRAKSPGVDEDLLLEALGLLKERIAGGLLDSTRDMLSLVQYAQKLREAGLDDPVAGAADSVLEIAGA
jgi:MoxR-like ATPase